MITKSNRRTQLFKIGKKHSGYFITTFIYSAIPLLFLPILTRYLSPSEYGNIALFRFYMAISNSLAGVSIPIMISKNFFDQEKGYISKIIGNSIFVSFSFSFITMILIILFSNIIMKYINLPLFWLVLIPWVSFFFVIFNIGLTVLRNQKKVLLFSKHKIGNVITNISISLLLVVILIWGWEGRVWGIILSFFISALFALKYLKSNGYLTLKFSKNTFKKILQLVLPLIPNSLQAVITAQIGVFFIQFYYSKELLGIYSVGFQIAFSIKLLFNTLSMSWSPYLYEKLSKSTQINKIQLVRYFYVIGFILFCGVLFVNLFSDLILRIIATKSYMGANEFIPYFTLGFLFNGLYIFLQPILVKNEKQKYLSLISFINMTSLIFLNIIFVKFFGYIGIAYAFAFSAFAMFLAFFIKTQNVYPLPWFKALIPESIKK